MAMLSLPHFLSFSLSHFKYFRCFHPHLNLQLPLTHWLAWLFLHWQSPKCEISSCPCLTETPPHPQVSATAEPSTPPEMYIVTHETLVHFSPNSTCDDPASDFLPQLTLEPSRPCILPAFLYMLLSLGSLSVLFWMLWGLANRPPVHLTKYQQYLCALTSYKSSLACKKNICILYSYSKVG